MIHVHVYTDDDVHVWKSIARERGKHLHLISHFLSLSLSLWLFRLFLLNLDCCFLVTSSWSSSSSSSAVSITTLLRKNKTWIIAHLFLYFTIIPSSYSHDHFILLTLCSPLYCIHKCIISTYTLCIHRCIWENFLSIFMILLSLIFLLMWWKICMWIFIHNIKSTKHSCMIL